MRERVRSERVDRELCLDLIVDAEYFLGRNLWYVYCHPCCLKSSEGKMGRVDIWRTMATSRRVAKLHVSGVHDV